MASKPTVGRERIQLKQPKQEVFSCRHCQYNLSDVFARFEIAMGCSGILERKLPIDHRAYAPAFE